MVYIFHGKYNWQSWVWGQRLSKSLTVFAFGPKLRYCNTPLSVYFYSVMFVFLSFGHFLYIFWWHCFCFVYLCVVRFLQCILSGRFVCCYAVSKWYSFCIFRSVFSFMISSCIHLLIYSLLLSCWLLIPVFLFFLVCFPALVYFVVLMFTFQFCPIFNSFFTELLVRLGMILPMFNFVIL